MSVSSETNKVIYNCDGSTTVFPYPFKIFEDSDLEVILYTIADGTETILTLTTDYTVSGAGDEAGGNVTTTSAYSSDYQLIIKRNIPYTQPVDYSENDPFPAETHEEALDRLTFLTQQLKGMINRALLQDESKTEPLDVPMLSAGKYLYTDGTSLSWSSVSTTDAQVFWVDAADYGSLSAAVAAIGSNNRVLLIRDEQTVSEDLTIPSNICLFFARPGKITVSAGVTLTINGAIKAGLYQIFDGDGTVSGSPKIEAVYPEWFGAAGDGTTDDTEAIQAAVDFYKKVYFSKTYRISSKISKTENGIVIWGSGIIKSDSCAFELTGDNITIRDLTLETYSTPSDKITRWDSNDNWISPISTTGEGYQPTVNDTDYGGTIPSGIACIIRIRNGEKNAFINLKGEQVCLEMIGCDYSKIVNCNISGGKDGGRPYGSILLMPKLGETNYYCEGNEILGNVIRYGSYSGICIMSQKKCLISNNMCYRNGESGIKTYQNDNTIDGDTYDTRNYNVIIANNTILQSVFDGIDAGMDYPHSGAKDGFYIIESNFIWNVNQTGVYIDASKSIISQNYIYKTRNSGIIADIKNSVIQSNYCVDCNLAENSGYNLISVTKDENLISNNFSTKTSSYSGGYNLYIAGISNRVLNNDVTDTTGVTDRLWDAGTNTIKIGNIDNFFSGYSFENKQFRFIKSASTDETPVMIENNNSSANYVSLGFHARGGLLANDLSKITCQLTYGVSGNESARLILKTIKSGSLKDGFILHSGDGNVAVPMLGCPSGWNATIPNNNFCYFYVDETNNKLKIKVKYSNGTEKTGAVSLT